MHGIDKTLRQGRNRLPILNRPINDLVIDIGNVANIDHLVAAGTQPPRHHIKHNHHAGVANVAKIIYRHAADVHLDLT